MELGVLILSSFVDVPFAVSFTGEAAWAGTSSSDSELLWKVDPSASLPDFLASSSSLLEFAASKPSPS